MKFINYRGDSLSKLALGTVQFGLDYGISNNEGKLGQAVADEIVSFLLSEKINCFDTAVAYGNSEAVLGVALGDVKGAFVVSKVKSDVFSGDLTEVVRESLEKLRIDAMFGLLLHDSKLLYHWSDEHAERVSALIEKGLIRNFGVSIYTDEEFELAVQNPCVRIIQVPFNVFDQRAVNRAWFQRADKAKKLIFIRSIFLQGLFFMQGEDLVGSLVEARLYLRCLHQWCEKTGLTVSEFAMAYVDSVAINSVLLFGSDALEQTQMNIKNYNKLPCFDEDTLADINKQFSDLPESIVDPSRWALS